MDHEQMIVWNLSPKFLISKENMFKISSSLLGLDDSGENADDRNKIPGAYLSFLMLRHLRLRDLNRTVSASNFFIILNFLI